MRTAEEIIRENFAWLPTGITMQALMKVINEVRKETIIECAERAAVEKSVMMQEIEPSIVIDYIVDKQSILNLINELQ